MADAHPGTAVPARDLDSPVRALVTALLVSLVCSALVTTAVTVLRPIQERRALVDLQRARVLAGADLAPGPGTSEDELWERVEPRVVDLASGETVAGVDADGFDMRRAARDPATSIEIPADLDVAEIGRRARQLPVYLVRREDGEGLLCVVLPIYGEGLYDTIRGYLSLAPDLRTVHHISFYEQGETPGLGGDIETPAWQAGWRGKQVFDDAGAPAIEVTVDTPQGPHQVEGISGATITGDSVTALVRYWVGEHGFGPFLARLREELQ